MNLFGFQIIVFCALLIVDIIFYFVLRNPSFPILEKQSGYEVFSVLIDPIFIGSVIFALNAFRKSHRGVAFCFITLPLLMTFLFYWAFH